MSNARIQWPYYLSACIIRRNSRALFLITLALLLGASTLRGQTYLESVGVPPFTTKLPVENGFINAANGNLHLEIPLGSFPQRGGREDKIVLMYDSAIWNLALSLSPNNIPPSGSSERGLEGGWRLVASGDSGWASYGETDDGWCNVWQDYRTATFSPFIWSTPDGTQHSFPIATITALHPSNCPISNDTPTGSAFASDGTGYYMSVSHYTQAVVYAPDGTIVHNDGTPNAPKDTNGNYYVQGTNLRDTLARTPATTTINGNTITYALLNSQGTTTTYIVTTEVIPVHTNFYGLGYGEFSGNMAVIQSIHLPDGTSYSFTYDQGTAAGHYGLLTSMTLPTGGQISYSYVTYVDPTTTPYRWVSGRTTPDGTWSYSPQALQTSCQAELNCQTQLTVAKPSGDTNVYTFTLNGGSWPTGVQYYDHSTGLLVTTSQCFSFVTVTNGSCTYSVISGYYGASNVHLLAATTTLPVPGGNLSKTVEYAWDSNNYGNVTQISEWNFGSSPSNAADRTTFISYLNSTSYINAHIIDRPTSVTIHNSGEHGCAD